MNEITNKAERKTPAIPVVDDTPPELLETRAARESDDAETPSLRQPPPPPDPAHGGSPDNNPKTQYGVRKLPLHLNPPIALAHMSTAFADGAKKYGPYNWREKKVSASVYIAPMQRHLLAYFDGETNAPDSGCHHLAHVMACCAIILDGESLGPDRFNDDRPTPGKFAEFAAEYAERMGLPEYADLTKPPQE